MEKGRKYATKKGVEPFYSDILKLSEEKQITLVAARKELIKKATKQNKKK